MKREKKGDPATMMWRRDEESLTYVSQWFEMIVNSHLTAEVLPLVII